MDFGQALEYLKDGDAMHRTGWNGTDLFVYLVPGQKYPVQCEVAKQYFGEKALVVYNAYFALKQADGTVSTWVPSVGDILAYDWEVTSA
jgi:hypothetical protein